MFATYSIVLFSRRYADIYLINTMTTFLVCLQIILPPASNISLSATECYTQGAVWEYWVYLEDLQKDGKWHFSHSQFSPCTDCPKVESINKPFGIATTKQALHNDGGGDECELIKRYCVRLIISIRHTVQASVPIY